MEQFKSLTQVMVMDEKHQLMGAVCGAVPDLTIMHKRLSEEVLNDEVPDELKGQFNVARNMALYTYFFYALAPEVHLKTYTIIEYALRIKADASKRRMLGELIRLAVDGEWISDFGFRHLECPSSTNEWCRSLESTLRSLRNSQAHGSNFLTNDCLRNIQICADFLNQLFPHKIST